MNRVILKDVMVALLWLILIMAVLVVNAQFHRAVEQLRGQTEELRCKNTELKQQIEQCKEQKRDVEKVVYYDINLSKDIQDYLFTECDKMGVDSVLVLALIKTESNFTPDIISGTNDYGLMQINEVNHSWLREKLGTLDFLDAKDNIKAGVYMLSRLKQQDVNQKLMVYNMGVTQAKTLWDSGIYSTEYTNIVTENMKYIEDRRVLK